MIQRIENNLYIPVEGVDLAGATKLEFYIKQGSFYEQYVPIIADTGPETSAISVRIPYKDAMKLSAASDCKIQLAFTDENGNPRASEILVVDVEGLLKHEGYNPV